MTTKFDISYGFFPAINFRTRFQLNELVNKLF